MKKLKFAVIPILIVVIAIIAIFAAKGFTPTHPAHADATSVKLSISVANPNVKSLSLSFNVAPGTTGHPSCEPAPASPQQWTIQSNQQITVVGYTTSDCSGSISNVTDIETTNVGINDVSIAVH